MPGALVVRREMVSVLASTLLFVVSLAVLLKASDVFTDSMERIGLGLGISPFVVGATIVAAGTSLPELASSVLAVFAGEPGIVAGNAVGSNVANIFLVLGTASVVAGSIDVDRQVMRVDLPLLTASAVFFLIAAWDGAFAWYEGVLALAGLAVYMEFSISNPGRLRGPVQSVISDHIEEQMAPTEDAEAEEDTATARDQADEGDPERSPSQQAAAGDPAAGPAAAESDETTVGVGGATDESHAVTTETAEDDDIVPVEDVNVAEEVTIGVRVVVIAVVSLAFVVIGANYLVEAILDVAGAVGVGTEFVAITAVAIGTSLPEIAVSVAAIRQGSADIAVGNVLGSNVFNTFGVMGVPSLLGTLAVPPSIRNYALPVMVVATVLYLFIAQDREITRYDGLALLLLYAIFLVNLLSFT